ncbi:ABC-2 type transport system ATP-binding protein [Murinocardiopsis flavida]|uniref:ABC-2 type transport system ATP-binding protein n=1 Tax=Murinocardiopsis flavida TaxID=645275 RepID=A0A2P8DHN6_9ACTN|nr:ABC transporter ATP-binding protein [Murinocardiopsis flavida]PSK96737.1 ABC-2 type transport system ATP-binding protein [Murinocardiopsis flavida]
MSPPAVEVVDLVKRYGPTTAVDRLSFTAPAGTVTALLGPNGAGKTSTIEICEGFRGADSGSVRVLGLDPRRAGNALKPRVGAMTQAAGIPTGARTGEWLRLMASFHARPVSPDLLLDRLGLAAAQRTPFRRLSGGQQQRLSLACAVVGRPELLFLDEPTAGLDPQARMATWDLVGELRSAGVSIVLTTHYMEEAERLADRVVIIDHGRTVADGSTADLTADRQELRFGADAGLDTEGLLTALPAASSIDVLHTGADGRCLYAIATGAPGGLGPEFVATVTTWFAANGVLPADLRVQRRTLEDVFLELTGRDLRES